MSGYPQWVTPERKAYLIDLFEKCGGFCIYGHRPCPHPEHHYQNHIEGVIDGWKADDREEKSEQLRLEQQILYGTPDVHGWGRRFDPVSRELFFEKRPPYYLEGIGISGLTFKRVAKIRVPSGHTRLFVDVDQSKPLSKNQRRKSRRYGFPVEEVQTVDSLCQAAVADFWEKV